MMKKLDNDDDFVPSDRCSKNSVRRAFREVVASSKKQGGLVCGIYEVAEFLRGGNAENIMFCVLVKSKDPANQMFCRLIEAYCWENNINIIKVDCGVKLTLMTDEDSDEIHYCVLVKKSEEDDSKTGPYLTILNYVKHKTTWSTLKIS